MKKIILFLIPVLVSIFWLCFKLIVYKVELSGQYGSIRILDEWKEVKTNSEKKDMAYSVIYAQSAIEIIQSRKSIIGRIVSDRIEDKSPKSKTIRMRAEKYMADHINEFSHGNKSEL